MSLFGTDTPETMPPKSTSSSSESGSSEAFLEFEGMTTFAPAPSPTYRYSMTLKNDKLRVWLEDCNSKKQWLASDLDQSDYVNSTNAILNATASDYIKYFHELLELGCDGKNVTPITFQRQKGGTFRLQMTLKIQVLKHSRVATYAIDMQPVSLDRVDVLESKMRNMQQDMKILRRESEKLKTMLGFRDKEISEMKEQMKTLLETQDITESFEFQATAKVADWIAWENLVLVHGFVPVVHPGTYQVTAIVNHKATNTTASIQLFNGPECIQTANCGIGETSDCSHSSTCLSCVARVRRNYVFKVKCPVSLMGTSYLTLVRIGK